MISLIFQENTGTEGSPSWTERLTLGSGSDMIPAHTEDLTPDGTADFVLVYDASAGGHKKVKLNNLPTAGGGEINTGSNVGTGAGQVFKAKSGVNFEFRNLAAGSSKLTVTNGANDITLDVAQANIDHDALTNFVANEHLHWTGDLGATNLHDNNLSTNIPRIASNQEWSKAQGNTESTPASSAGVPSRSTSTPATTMRWSAVGKRIRGDVDDAHDQWAVKGKCEGAAAKHNCKSQVASYKI